MIMGRYSYAIRSNTLLRQHKEYISGNNWNQIRLHVLKRDNYTCVKCGKNGGKLYVHHKTYKRWSNENINDLVTLCYNCHEEIHGRN